ncbi:acyl carrier protein [Cystoisospora suis]|uniref:Acyl carrier protein n=1 Tax=Cystoisospora suis TaxID=483139 RepID=A0A2C6JBZ0_9APIC|nr:acyl carrier protein [Cystoisospora suis]
MAAQSSSLTGVPRIAYVACIVFLFTLAGQSQSFVTPGVIRFNYRYGTCPNQRAGLCVTASPALGGRSQPLQILAGRRTGLRGLSLKPTGASGPLFAGGDAGSEEKPLLERVKDVVAEQLGVDRARVTPESNFIKDLDADSLDSVELVMAFEEKFDVNIPDEEASKIATVQDALNYIEKAKKSTA